MVDTLKTLQKDSTTGYAICCVELRSMNEQHSAKKKDNALTKGHTHKKRTLLDFHFYFRDERRRKSQQQKDIEIFIHNERESKTKGINIKREDGTEIIKIKKKGREQQIKYVINKLNEFS